MGYCYQDGKLCCDACGAVGGVRKRRCPYGWCSAPAICRSCWQNGEREKCKSYHAELNCQDKSAQYAREKAEERALLNQGAWIRSAVVAEDGGRVKVWFRNKNGEELVQWMAPETYNALPLLKPYTPADYALHGEVWGE